MQVVDVIAILQALEAVGVATWLDGGWGVDALVGEQTRPHQDLDLVIAIEQAGAVREVLAALGFVIAEDEMPTRFVLGDEQGRQIDFHPVTFDSEGGGLQRQPDGSVFRYPPEGLLGRGQVGGRPVRCLTPELQVLCHLGYQPDENDHHDMLLLHECCGIGLPLPYASLQRDVP